MKNSIKWMILSIGILTSLYSISQERIVKSDFWFTNLNHLKIGEKWAIGNEIHLRRTDFLKTDEQLIVRPWLTFKPNKFFATSVGYSYVRTYPYTSYMLQFPVEEHNVWEQVTLYHESKRVKFSHRIRLEQRFRKKYEQQADETYHFSGFGFSQRFRYRLTLKVPFAKRFFFMAFNEIWVKTDGNFTNPTYDRNWLYLGFGVKPFKNATIQLGYLHQSVKVGTSYQEIHPTFAVQWQYDFQIKLKKKITD
jgi:hypothetical protein